MSDNREIKRVLAIGQLPVEAGGNYTTGMGKVVYELSRQSYPGLEYSTMALNAKDKRVDSPTYFGYTLPVGMILRYALLHPVKLVRELRDYKLNLDYSPLRALFYRLNMDRVIDRLSPDCVHLHSIDNVIPFSHTEKGKCIKSIVTCHGIFGVEDNKRRVDFYVESLSRVDHAIGLTREIDRQLEAFSVPAERRSIIPNGVDVTKFRFDSEARRSVRAEMGVSDERIVFITVGSLQHRKGQLDFMKQLKDSGVDYEYWLIGSGPDRKTIEQWINENELNDRIRLIGYVPGGDLYRYYSAADVYAHTSYNEGQALSEIEAYTTGLKILVNGSVAGTLANSPETNARYRVISLSDSNVWSNDTLRWIYEKPVGRKTEGKLSWQKIADMYNGVYKMLLKTL